MINYFHPQGLVKALYNFTYISAWHKLYENHILLAVVYSVTRSGTVSKIVVVVEQWYSGEKPLFEQMGVAPLCTAWPIIHVYMP